MVPPFNCPLIRRMTMYVCRESAARMAILTAITIMSRSIMSLTPTS